MHRRDFLKSTGAVAGIAAGAATGLAGATSAVATTAALPAAPLPATGAVAAPAVLTGARPIMVRCEWPKGIPVIGDVAARLERRITEASGGRFIPVELVETFSEEVVENVIFLELPQRLSKSAMPGGQLGGHFFASVPYGMTPEVHSDWLVAGGGQGLWDLVAAQSHRKLMHLGSLGSFPGLWSRRPIATLADFRGRRFGTTGFGTTLVEALGATPVSYPYTVLGHFDDVHPALDAFEGVSAAFDQFDDVSARMPYLAVPGITTGGFALHASVRLPVWRSFSAADQRLIESAVAAEAAAVTARARAANLQALAGLRDQRGLTVLPFDFGTIDALSTLAREAVSAAAAADADAALIAASYYDFMDSHSGAHAGLPLA